jgi:hypothetical protein
MPNIRQTRSAARRFAVAAAALFPVLAAALPPLDPSELLGRIDVDPQCAEATVVGACLCGPSPCGVRVVQFVPVAFVETVPAPGQSLIGAVPSGASGAAGTGSSSLSITDNTAEAHVWALPDVPPPGMPCPSCSPSRAAASPAPVSGPDATTGVCGPAAQVVRAIAEGAAALAGPLLPTLAYASELDAFNWRTGCRDLAAGGSSLAATALACDAGADAQGCLGRWGPLRPRQMRDIGPTPLLYSAKTAVRAMSIAREQLGTFRFPVDTAGRLQQAYPVRSACFGVGQLPLPQAPGSAHPTVASADGRYGWIYWRRATCCLTPADAGLCLRTR